MGIGYTLAYRLGITPWEQAGEGAAEQFGGLLDRETADRAPGRALDLGCGRGAHSVELARRGWRVTGIDLVPRALTAARARAAAAGVDVDFVEADVTDLPLTLGTDVDFVLDVGCFHGLSRAGQRQFGVGVKRVTAPDATMLVLAFAPGGRGPLPAGADAADLEAALPGWVVQESVAASTGGMPAPLRRRAPRFHRLVRTP